MIKEEAIHQILSKVTGRFGVKDNHIFDKSKERHHIDARHMFYYICKKNKVNIHYIQSFANQYYSRDINHSSIVYAQKQMKEKVLNDSHWKSLYKEINSK